MTVRGVHARPVGLPDDPGFAGLSAGGGIALELRAFRYFGLEIDLLRSRDAGTAELSVTQLGTTRSFSLEIVSVGWHVPLLLKGVLPTDPVRPFVAFGPEIVLSEQADAIVEGELAPGVEYRAVPRSYLMLTAAIGAELLLPVADTDLRIPLSLRASVTPAIGSSRDERARYLGQDALDISRVEYDARWQYQAVLTLGALVHF